MKKTIAVLTVLFLLVLLAGCTLGEKSEKIEETITKDVKEKGRVQIAKQDGFVFTLSSDQRSYKKGEKINIQAYMEYTGEKKKIEISHSNPIITYVVTDEERNILMPPAAALDMKMNSEFKKGQKDFLLKQSIDTETLDVINGNVFIEAVVRFHVEDQEYVLKNILEVSLTEEMPQEVMMIENDFVFTLESDKKTYTKGEEVRFQAFIKYIGEQEEIEIVSASNPLTYEIFNEKKEEVAPMLLSLSEAVTYKLIKNQKIELINEEYDTKKFNGNEITIDADVNFEFEGKKYSIPNALTFKIQ